MSRLWREGEEYNTRKGNNSAQDLSRFSLLGFYPPAASVAEEGPAGGVLNRQNEEHPPWLRLVLRHALPPPTPFFS